MQSADPAGTKESESRGGENASQRGASEEEREGEKETGWRNWISTLSLNPPLPYTFPLFLRLFPCMISAYTE